MPALQATIAGVAQAVAKLLTFTTNSI